MGSSKEMVLMNLKEAILDALVDDGETIIQIREYINYLGINTQFNRIIDSLNNLYVEGKIKVVYPPNFNDESLESIDDLEELWFELTPIGKREWEKIK
jgi:hypothetical protein